MLEPELVDVSAFDVELDPSRVPTFGAIVDGQTKRRKPVRKSLVEDDKEPYKPPPPPDAAPPGAPPVEPTEPGSGSGVFGDW